MLLYFTENWFVIYKIMEFKIEKTWDNQNISHKPVNLKLLSSTSSVKLMVDAPYFGDCPFPPAESGKPCANLWDYEGMQCSSLCSLTYNIAQ